MKGPPNTPGRGDRVIQRGKAADRQGVVEKMDDTTKWATIEWDDKGGPRVAHLHELERVNT